MTIPVNAGVNGELVAKAPRRITPQAVDDDVADPVGSRRVRQPSQKLLESSPNDKRPRLDDGPQNGQHGDDDPVVVELRMFFQAKLDGRAMVVPGIWRSPQDVGDVYGEVVARGGYKEVCDARGWKEVCATLGQDLDGQASAG